MYINVCARVHVYIFFFAVLKIAFNGRNYIISLQQRLRPVGSGNSVVTLSCWTIPALSGPRSALPRRKGMARKAERNVGCESVRSGDQPRGGDTSAGIGVRSGMDYPASTGDRRIDNPEG